MKNILLGVFCRAAKNSIEGNQEIRASYDDKVKPLTETIELRQLIKMLCELPEKNNGKFEEAKRTDDKNFLMGVEFRVRGSVISRIEFGVTKDETDNYTHFIIREENKKKGYIANSTNAAEVLGEWMTNIVPDRVSEMKKKQNIALRILHRLG
ncbi:MAG: hypothetical protein KAI76_00165 [Alphaproteobacteria bacterium]|nr:hypothetical protein [Alphaproteobacteria bacterium]